MSDTSLRLASSGELTAVYNAVGAARLFDGRAEFDRFFAEDPWRVQVTDSGEALVLERWREHLDLLAVRGLWCAERRIAPIMDAAYGSALEHGYSGLLSPLIAQGYVRPYLDAGMHVCQRTVVMSLPRPARRSALDSPLTAGVTLRESGPADAEALLAADARIFESFWRYDAPTMARLLRSGRTIVAEAAGDIVGYTQMTIKDGEGLLGRLGVVPSWRGRGLGAALLEDSLRYLVTQDATLVTLCTQEDNAVSRTLYGHAGFRLQPGTSVMLTR